MRARERSHTFETFGEWLKYHRKAERYSLRILAEEMTHRGFKMSHSYVANLEEDLALPDDITVRISKATIDSFAVLLEADAAEGKRLMGYQEVSEEPEIEREAVAIEFYDNVAPDQRSKMFDALRAVKKFIDSRPSDDEK